ncbi:hypothetical protein [Coleofasciculus sp. FACHB-1120]|nr:hypothetical protein [Coleofasciculus sp. FACHB-1120]MBD2743966.1 hypothetical protein [Coleofasciculus sp. FACHB-1120]
MSVPIVALYRWWYNRTNEWQFPRFVRKKFSGSSGQDLPIYALGAGSPG